MYSGNIAPWEQYPKNLRFSEIVNPLKVLSDFFSSGRPKDHCRELKQWRYYVLNDKCYKDRHGSGNLLFVYDQTLQLIEAMHLLLLQNKGRWQRQEDVSEGRLAQEKESWPYFPGKLSQKELADPYRAVKKCFKKIGPQQYRDYLHEWLQTALYDNAADETLRAGEITDVYDNIRTLYFAAWLVHQRENNQTKTYVSLEQGDTGTGVHQAEVHQAEGQKAPLNGNEHQGQEQKEPNGPEEKRQEKETVVPEQLSPLKDIKPKLTKAEELGLDEVKNLITGRFPLVRLVYLLGTHHSPFTYYLLVLIDDKEKTPEHEVANKIEDHCRFLASVFALVHKLASAKEGIAKGKRFWNGTLVKSTCIYTAPNTALTVPRVVGDSVWLERSAQDWDRWGGQGRAFLKGAVRYIEEGEHSLALFSLHQAAESSLIAIIRAVLGYRLSVHNLARMVRLTLLFTEEVKKVLQLDSLEGVQLFGLLQTGYSEARYKNGFKPDAQSVWLLKEKAGLLLEKTEQVYRQFVSDKRSV